NRGAAESGRRIGFQYMNAVMQDLELYYPPGAHGEFEGGMWIDQDYSVRNWGSHIVGKRVSAFALLKILVGLATETLIDPTASQQMKSLMDRADINFGQYGHSGYYEVSLERATPRRTFSHLYCKLGRVGARLNDCILL